MDDEACPLDPLWGLDGAAVGDTGAVTCGASGATSSVAWDDEGEVASSSQEVT